MENPSVSVAGVGFYGYYGQLDDDPVTTPLAHVGPLRATFENPVVYAELPGAQHSFDLFHSVRFETAIDGIERFTAWLRTERTPALTAGRDGGSPRPS